MRCELAVASGDWAGDGSSDGETGVEDTLSTQISGREKATCRLLLLLHTVEHVKS